MSSQCAVYSIATTARTTPVKGAYKVNSSSIGTTPRGMEVCRQLDPRTRTREKNCRTDRNLCRVRKMSDQYCILTQQPGTDKPAETCLFAEQRILDSHDKVWAGYS